MRDQGSPSAHRIVNNTAARVDRLENRAVGSSARVAPNGSGLFTAGATLSTVADGSGEGSWDFSDLDWYGLVGFAVTADGYLSAPGGSYAVDVVWRVNPDGGNPGAGGIATISRAGETRGVGYGNFEFADTGYFTPSVSSITIGAGVSVLNSGLAVWGLTPATDVEITVRAYADQLRTY